MITKLEPYEYKGFLIRENDFGKALIMSDKRVLESSEFVKNEGIIGLELNHSLGYGLDNLNCLKYFDTIRNIRILNDSLNIEGVYYLKNLENLMLGDESQQEIDFTMLKNLKSCFFSWRKKAESIFDCVNLYELGIEGYKSQDLIKFKNLNSLRYLGLGNSTIMSLNGIEFLKKLNELSLSYLKNLSSLNGLEYVNITNLDLSYLPKLSNLNSIKKNITLNRIDILKCKSINDISFLSNLIDLEYLSIEDIGEIKTLRPIEKLAKLKVLFFIGNTNILDGNLYPIESLQYLENISFKNRKHYSHKREHFKAFKE